MTRKEARAVIEAMILERQELLRGRNIGPAEKAKAAREIAAITAMLPSTRKPL